MLEIKDVIVSYYGSSGGCVLDTKHPGDDKISLALADAVDRGRLLDDRVKAVRGYKRVTITDNPWRQYYYWLQGEDPEEVDFAPGWRAFREARWARVPGAERFARLFFGVGNFALLRSPQVDESPRGFIEGLLGAIAAHYKISKDDVLAEACKRAERDVARGWGASGLWACQKVEEILS